MQRTCTRCAHLVARSAAATPPLLLRPAASASRQLAQRTPVQSCPLHALARSPRPSLFVARTPRSTLTATVPSSRRGIVCPAQPPTDPTPDFEPVEDDLQPGESLDINLSDAAINQILRAQAAAKNPSLALRLAVESGGCHGYQYKMQVTSSREPDDYLFTAETEKGTAALVVDAASLPLVKGSTVDYATELIGSAFRIRDNPQSKDAGCGCGVSWELKDLEL